MVIVRSCLKSLLSHSNIITFLQSKTFLFRTLLNFIFKLYVIL